MATVRIRYGNTNTFLINGRLLVDTDYAGTIRAFYRTLKASGIRLDSITHVMATHYHPDHCGLIGELQQKGIKLILLETQRDSVHFPDYIFKRDGIAYIPVDDTKAEIMGFRKSREYLRTLRIEGEIIATPSHSQDSVSLILDDGDCMVGDLQPREYFASLDEEPELKADWDHILEHRPKRILYAHIPEKRLE